MTQDWGYLCQTLFKHRRAMQSTCDNITLRVNRAYVLCHKILRAEVVIKKSFHLDGSVHLQLIGISLVERI